MLVSYIIFLLFSWCCCKRYFSVALHTLTVESRPYRYFPHFNYEKNAVIECFAVASGLEFEASSGSLRTYYSFIHQILLDTYAMAGTLLVVNETVGDLVKACSAVIEFIFCLSGADYKQMHNVRRKMHSRKKN